MIIVNAPVQMHQIKLMKKESNLLFDIDIKFSSPSKLIIISDSINM